MGNYLIPANSKKSQMILGLFTPIDLIIFITGIVITVILLLIIKSTNIWIMIAELSPALIAGFLVLPVPHYHNIMQLLTNIITFYTERRKYYWKGWCVTDET